MEKRAWLVQGLIYGDEGKGQTVDFICRTRDVNLVVRFCGGPQSGHNVVTPEGLHHEFSQFGSGTFIDGCRTFLSRFMLIEPFSMMNEERHLQELGIRDAFDRTLVDEQCLVITPFQKAVNQIHQRVHGRHSSCGRGVGQTREDHLREGNKVLFAGDLHDKKKTEEKLRFIQGLSLIHVSKYNSMARKICKEQFDILSDPWFKDALVKQYAECPIKTVPRYKITDERVVFEGAQGVLLDESFGDREYNTWTNTTFENAERLLEESGWDGRVQKIGVIRTYMTRHGEGPLPTEDLVLDHLPEPHNRDSGYQGKFRRGHFDFRLVLRAIDICGGIDGIALNHCDHIGIDEARRTSSYLKIIIRGFGPSANERSWIGTRTRKLEKAVANG